MRALARVVAVGAFVWVVLSNPAPLAAAPAPSPAAATSPAPSSSDNADALTAPAQGVTPLSLDEALAIGLERNPRLKVAAEQVVQARARYNELQSGKRLKLNVDNRTVTQRQQTVDTTRLFPAGTVALPAKVTLVERLQDQFQAGLQQLITTFGRLENQIAAALIQVGVAVQDAEATRRQLIFDVKQAYFERLRAEANDRVTALNLASAEQTLQDTDLRFRQGLLARYDLLQAQLEVTNASQRRDQAATDLTTSEVRLRSLLFEPTDRVLWSVSPRPVEVDASTSTRALEEMAFTHRPELSAIALNLDAARKLVSAAKADNQPTLSLQFNYITNAGNNLAPSDVTNGVLVLTWPFIDGGQRNARVKNAESQLRAIEDNQALQRQAVRQQVQEAWARLQLALKNVETARSRLDIAASFHTMARLRFVGGVGTSLEMQNAVRSLNDARLSYVLTRTELDLAFAALEQSLGVDFPDRRLAVSAAPVAPSTPPAPSAPSAPGGTR